MDEQKLTENLKTALGDHLKSVVLYGSHVIQDQTKRFSKINLLVVVDEVSSSVLKTCVPVFHSWQKAGHPAPVLFSERQVRESHDVFPLEFLDIQAHHRVLTGADFFSNLSIRPDHLRHQIEFELRSKLIQLRQGFLTVGGNSKRVAEMLAESLSGLTALFKGVLRLCGESVPDKKQEVWQSLAQRVGFDLTTFQHIFDIRAGQKNKSINSDDLFAQTLKTIENVINFVNHYEKEGVAK